MNGTFRNAVVADVMSHEVISCPSDATLATLARTLVSHAAHAVFVFGGQGRPVGVVSDFDLLTGEWLGTDPESLRTMRRVTAAELMSSPIETISPSAPVVAAAHRMLELHIGRLLVTDGNGAAVGVISVSDLITPLGSAPPERQTVRDVMSYAIVTCLPDASVESVARAMTERHSRSVVVVDDSGRAVGVISGTDLLPLYEGEPSQTAAEVMSAPVIAAEPDLALAVAADLMISNEVHRLVVIDPAGPQGAPIGVVSTSDIITEMAQVQSVWQDAEA